MSQTIVGLRAENALLKAYATAKNEEIERLRADIDRALENKS